MTSKTRTQSAVRPAERSREDDTTQTILERATQRARRVSERCRPNASTLRPPTPGPVERVDPTRLARVRPTPIDTPYDDPFHLSLRQPWEEEPVLPLVVVKRAR